MAAIAADVSKETMQGSQSTLTPSVEMSALNLLSVYPLRLNLPCLCVAESSGNKDNIEVDEIWGVVGAKRKIADIFQ